MLCFSVLRALGWSTIVLMASSLGCSSSSSSPSAPASSAVGSPPAVPASVTNARFSLRIHNGVGMIAKYTYDTVEPKVANLPSEGAIAVIDERDIDEYRVAEVAPGPSVEIVLSEAATKRIAPGAVGSEETAFGWQQVFGEGPFSIRLDGKFLFGGQCYPVMGAAALRYPVIHVRGADRGKRMVLAIKPQQAPWLDPDDPASASRIDPPVLRDHFRSLGRLGPLPH